MNREIKFEYGFQSVNGIVKKVYALSEIPEIKEKCDVWGILPIAYVREYTGLKDKNGKEIYEGDVLVLNLERSFKKMHSEPFLMQWNPEKAAWTFYSPREIVEVIGNIYENPELL